MTGTGWWKKSFRAPESFVGFCGTRGSHPDQNIRHGTSYGVGEFGTIWPMLTKISLQVVITGTGWWEKSFQALRVLRAFAGPGGFEHVTGQGGGKKLLGPPKVLSHAPFLSTSLPLFSSPFPLPIIIMWATGKISGMNAMNAA